MGQLPRKIMTAQVAKSTKALKMYQYLETASLAVKMNPAETKKPH
jgi:hypothetical protein